MSAAASFALVWVSIFVPSLVLVIACELVAIRRAVNRIADAAEKELGK